MGVPAPVISLHSESLLGSLCREVDQLRGRARQLSASLERCQNRSLLLRLGRERIQLMRRRKELLEIARSWRRRGGGDPLAIEFLIEVASRPLGE